MSPSMSPSTSLDNTDPRVSLGARLHDLHHRGQAFVVPNPWDQGSARILEQFGFEALATTSAGFATSIGRPDGHATRDQVLDHVEAIAGATDLPVTADLEHGYGDEPQDVAATIAAVAARGAVGGSIEDRSGRTTGGTLYDLDLAIARIEAAVQAARALPFRFTLTARCECFLVGRHDLDEAILRLRSYAEAGADVLYAPGLTSRDEIERLVDAVDRPVNVVMGLSGVPFGVGELSAMGVSRISLGSTLSRLAYGSLFRAASELRSTGTFGFAADAIPYADLDASLAAEAGK